MEFNQTFQLLPYSIIPNNRTEENNHYQFFLSNLILHTSRFLVQLIKIPRFHIQPSQPHQSQLLLIHYPKLGNLNATGPKTVILQRTPTNSDMKFPCSYTTSKHLPSHHFLVTIMDLHKILRIVNDIKKKKVERYRRCLLKFRFILTNNEGN